MKPLILFICLLLACSGLKAQTSNDTLKIGIYNSPPFVIYHDDAKVEGVSMWLWEQMKDDIAQPYQFVSYSSEEPLQEILNDLGSGKIDLSINPITITSHRNRSIDFTHPFYVGNLTIAKKHKANLKSISPILSAIFSNWLLNLILILALMVAVFGFLIWMVEKQNDHFEKGIKGLVSSFWWSAVTMSTVGYGDKVPISNLGRFIAFIWMLCSIILISVFSASITSHLTVQKLAEGSYVVEDFKTSRVGTVGASATESILKRNFFRDVETYPEFLNGLRALEKDQIDVFVYDEPWLNYQINNNPEFKSLEVLPIRFETQLYAMPLQKNLDRELQHRISMALLKLTETKDWQLLLDDYQLAEY